jgi:hypothetical protein
MAVDGATGDNKGNNEQQYNRSQEAHQRIDTRRHIIEKIEAFRNLPPLLEHAIIRVNSFVN